MTSPFSNSRTAMLRAGPAALVAIALMAAALVALATPTSAAPTPSYPLRHSFSLVPGLPGGNSTTPTSCWNVDASNYVCRLVWGYEETGSAQNYLVLGTSALSTKTSATYGRNVVSKAGNNYEGCTALQSDGWYYCDYKVTEMVSRPHYVNSGWVLNVLWKWTSYTGDQVGCAAAVTGLWYGSSAFAVLLNSCKNGPM